MTSNIAWVILFSLFKGKYIEDRIASAKLSFYIFVCLAVVAVEFGIVYGLITWIMGEETSR